jgi:hypothetical protein
MEFVENIAESEETKYCSEAAVVRRVSTDLQRPDKSGLEVRPVDKTIRPQCALCDLKGTLKRCSRCRLVYFCSKFHQISDWAVHKTHCTRAYV